MSGLSRRSAIPRCFGPSLLGWLAFGNLPDRYALIGAAIVVATGIYTLLRERKLRSATGRAAA